MKEGLEEGQTAGPRSAEKQDLIHYGNRPRAYISASRMYKTTPSDRTSNRSAGSTSAPRGCGAHQFWREHCLSVPEARIRNLATKVRALVAFASPNTTDRCGP